MLLWSGLVYPFPDSQLNSIQLNFRSLSVQYSHTKQLTIICESCPALSRLACLPAFPFLVRMSVCLYDSALGIAHDEVGVGVDRLGKWEQ